MGSVLIDLEDASGTSLGGNRNAALDIAHERRCVASAANFMSVARQSEIVLCADANKDPDVVQAPPYAHVAGGRPSCSGEASDRSDGTPTRATNLSVTIQADGSSSITAAPGSVFPYQVVAGLSRNAGERLAFLVLDLEFHGGDLPQADTPTNLAAVSSGRASAARHSGRTSQRGMGPLRTSRS